MKNTLHRQATNIIHDILKDHSEDTLRILRLKHFTVEQEGPEIAESAAAFAFMIIKHFNFTNEPRKLTIVTKHDAARDESGRVKYTVSFAFEGGEV